MSQKRLTDEEINMAIAKVMFDFRIENYKLVPYQNAQATSGYRCDLSGLWIYNGTHGFYGCNYNSKKELYEGNIKQDKKLYTTDLNAMAEAEKVLTPSQKIRYWNLLGDILSENGTKPWSLSDLIFVTAKQRAIAFLHALNLWKD